MTSKFPAPETDEYDSSESDATVRNMPSYTLAPQIKSVSQNKKNNWNPVASAHMKAMNPPPDGCANTSGQFQTLRPAELKTWDHLVDAMRSYFQEPVLAKVDFAQIAQGNNETLDKLSARISDCARIAFPRFPTKELEKMKCEQLVDALASSEM